MEDFERPRRPDETKRTLWVAATAGVLVPVDILVLWYVLTHARRAPGVVAPVLLFFLLQVVTICKCLRAPRPAMLHQGRTTAI